MRRYTNLHLHLPLGSNVVFEMYRDAGLAILLCFTFFVTSLLPN